MSVTLKRMGWWGGVVSGWLVMLVVASACSLFDSRPQNLRGEVRCQAQSGAAAQPLLVQVVLDQAAVQQRSTFDVIRRVLVPSRLGEKVLQLQVDVGMATGAIQGCGSFTDPVIHIDITDQMLSYPSWIRIGTRASDAVTLTIQDTNGNDLIAPLRLAPNPERFTIQWLE